MNFDSKTVLITGAARGIGRATAQALADEGARVLLLDIAAEEVQDLASELRASGKRADAYVCDLSDDLAVEDVGKRIEAEAGAPDVIINNAYVPILGSLESIVLDQWRKAFEVNILGMVRVVKALSPGMIHRGSGHIVNVASPMGIVQDAPAAAFMLPYCASKGAVVAFTSALAVAMEPHGIGVSIFYPDVTKTGNADRNPDRGPIPPEFVEMLKQIMVHGATTQSSADALLKGLKAGDYLISAEQGFAERLVRGAAQGFDARLPTRI